MGLSIKLVRVVGVVLLATASLVIAVGLALPSTWHVERTVVISAPREEVFRFVGSLPAWRLWTRWNDATAPDTRWAFGGPASGTGAWMSWSGSNTGRGSLRVRESDPARGIAFDEVIDSALVNARGALTWASTDEGTRVTWTEDGRLPSILGPYFRSSQQETREQFIDAGLRNLKVLTETESNAVPPRAAALSPQRRL